MQNSWDVVIVGARCAGATLATHLARAGVRTLLLEASPRGTNLPLSTHFIQPPGVAALGRLGLGARAQAVAPLTKRFRVALDDVELVGDFPEGNQGLCLRRSTLDPWLQETAEAAGAELRDRHRVTGLLRDGDRVTGVVAQGPSGSTEEIRAGLVVGADGPKSTVAKLTHAREYLVTESGRGGYFFYFPAPARWNASWDSTLEHRGNEVRYVFRTDGDLVLVVGVTTQAEARTWGARWKEKTLDMLRASPTTRPFVEGKQPVGKGCGLLEARYFYREPVGKGYALVGDAGHFKDFVTGQGMTDAFLDAERLARAVLDGREVAYEHFWRERDVATLPLHFDAIQQGTVGFNSPFMRAVFSHLRDRPDLKERLPKVFSRTLSPYDMIPMSAMLPWMAGALLRGRFDVLRGFLASGKAIAREQKEIAARQALLDEVTARFAPAARAA
jgi:menaquinone-9 beta-reductase